MKKIYSTALMAVAALSLVACSTATQSSEEASTAAGETQAAVDGAENLVIGSMGPLTGAAASYGHSVKNGAEIAIKEINEAGGVKLGDKTYNLVLNFQDDEASEDKAVTAYNTLMDSKVDVLMASVTSGSSMAIADLSAADNILQITPSGSVAAITANDNVFRLCFTDPLQGKMLAEYVVEKGYKSVAILYNNADEYSTGIYEAFKEELVAAGKDSVIVAEESFVTEDVDYTAQLTKIKSTGSELIFVPGYYAAAAYITKQARDLGIEADFLGSDGWDGVLGQVTDTSVLEGAVFLSPFLPTDSNPAVQDFVKKYEEAYGAIPDQFAADGYDTVYVIKAAFEKAGTKDTADLIKAMTEINVEGLTGNVSFDASGEPNKQPKFVGIESGAYVAK